MSASQRSIQTLQAAANKARWCDAVCQAHGALGAFQEYLWLSRWPAPRFYPNLVTLTAEAGIAAQLAAVRELRESAQPGAFAVKDSFASLDLAPLGFQVLFEATWIWRDAALPSPANDDPGLRWAIITEPADLTIWEAAWSGPPADTTVIPDDRAHTPARPARTAPAAGRMYHARCLCLRRVVLAGETAGGCPGNAAEEG